MPAPNLGKKIFDAAARSSAQELTEAPEMKLLGTLDPEKLRRLEDERPPWETDPKWTRDNTNARRFVDVPDHWELRWLNPRLIDVSGMRDWQAVPAAGDPRVTVKNRAMIAPDNTVRRGGHGGSLLAFMPKTWVESRQRLKEELVAKRTQSAIDRQKSVTEEIQRGHFGPYVKVDSARHPTHTRGDGRTMVD